MPSMYDIYDGHAGGYDGLVSREDHQGNLKANLMSEGPWDRAVVVEAGIGTGRLTRLYMDRVDRVLGFDRSNHMLARASENLADAGHKIT
ncbi:MAG: class I SAM-dependent methyltransferase, partial [Spirochaetales bacterium]